MTRVVHVLQQLTLGGAARSHVAIAKYSSKSGDFQHAMASLLPPQLEAVELARSSGLEVLPCMDRGALAAELGRADIVHVGWWNTPELDDLLRSDLPALRMCIWFHVAGDHPPQFVTRELVGMADLAMAACPHTLRIDAMRDLPEDERHRRCALVYDAADFARLGEIRSRTHAGFNVGYAGTLSFQKLHPDYIRMSAGIHVPDVRFVVCGAGEQQLRSQAEALGVADRFDFRGYVSDIESVFAELDVFGYPLCENTYAAGELVLQEAMYAGIPPVVFPHGGLRDLVIDGFTGLVVTTELEYRQAVEHLYGVPEERERLGRNAREYASQIFGAENASRALNRAYERLLEAPKRVRKWGVVRGGSLLDVPVSVADLSREAPDRGASRFLEGLGPRCATLFRDSCADRDDGVLFPGDDRIAMADDLLWEGAGGLRSYRAHYAGDPWLRFWSGLVLRERGKFAEAVSEFRSALRCGFPHWRALWYLAQSAFEAGQWWLTERTLRALGEQAPGCPGPPGAIERLAASVRERRSLLERFREEMERGDLAGAEASLGETVAVFPNSPDVQNAWAEYEFQAGDRRQAIELLERLAETSPDHPEILNNLAVVRWLDGDRGSALSLLQVASDADPDDPRVKMNLAELSGDAPPA